MPQHNMSSIIFSRPDSRYPFFSSFVIIHTSVGLPIFSKFFCQIKYVQFTKKQKKNIIFRNILITFGICKTQNQTYFDFWETLIQSTCQYNSSADRIKLCMVIFRQKGSCYIPKYLVSTYCSRNPNLKLEIGFEYSVLNVSYRNNYTLLL